MTMGKLLHFLITLLLQAKYPRGASQAAIKPIRKHAFPGDSEPSTITDMSADIVNLVQNPASSIVRKAKASRLVSPDGSIVIPHYPNDAKTDFTASVVRGANKSGNVASDGSIEMSHDLIASKVEFVRAVPKANKLGNEASYGIDQILLMQLEQNTSVGTEKNSSTKNPYMSATCADIGSTNVPLVQEGKCPAWVFNGGYCDRDWAITACPASCKICALCVPNNFGNWSPCTSTCGGGGQIRTGTCGSDNYTESRQCNTEACDPGTCHLNVSDPLIIITDNEEVENVEITTDGIAPAIFVYGASNVTLRNIKIIHTGQPRVQGNLDNHPLLGNLWVDQSGAGIYFQDAANIKIENVHVSLVRPSPNPNADGADADQYCGPFPITMKYAYNIYGTNSYSPSLSNVYVTGGSTGFWCQNCADGTVSHFKAENMHGPYPRGQCFQIVSSPGFTLEEFTCIQDNECAFPEDDISIWNSSHALVQGGFIQGNNAPNGVGVISEMSDHVLVQDVDVTLVGGTQFSAYGAYDVTFLRTRAKDNYADGTCLSPRGHCKDPGGLWPNSNYYEGDQTLPDKTCCGDDALKRCDTKSGVWFAGDYTADQADGAYDHQASGISIRQGVFYGMTSIESEEDYSNVGHCVTIDMAYWANSAANRQEAYILKDFANMDFTLRVPFTPSFCFLKDTELPYTPST